MRSWKSAVRSVVPAIGRVDVLVAEHLAADLHAPPRAGRSCRLRQRRGGRAPRRRTRPAARRSRGARRRASTSSRAPGIRVGDRTRAVRRAASAGSSAPAITSVGARDLAQPLAEVPAGDRLAAARVALGGRADEHRARKPRHDLGSRREPRREPAPRGPRPRPRSTPVRAHDRRALEPPLALAEASPRCRRATSRSTRSGAFAASHMPGRAADRQAAERGALEPELVEQLEHVAAELVDAYGPGGTGEPPWPRWS